MMFAWPLDAMVIITLIRCGLSLFILKHFHAVYQCLLKIRHAWIKGTAKGHIFFSYNCIEIEGKITNNATFLKSHTKEAWVFPLSDLKWFTFSQCGFNFKTQFTCKEKCHCSPKISWSIRIIPPNLINQMIKDHKKYICGIRNFPGFFNYLKYIGSQRWMDSVSSLCFRNL